MKPMKPNTQEQLDRINVEIRKKSRRWIYYNALDNPLDSGWLRERACDQSSEIYSASLCRYQLTPPNGLNEYAKRCLYDPER